MSDSTTSARHDVEVVGTPPSEPFCWSAHCTCGRESSVWDTPRAAREELDRLHASEGIRDAA